TYTPRPGGPACDALRGRVGNARTRAPPDDDPGLPPRPRRHTAISDPRVTPGGAGAALPARPVAPSRPRRSASCLSRALGRRLSVDSPHFLRRDRKAEQEATDHRIDLLAARCRFPSRVEFKDEGIGHKVNDAGASLGGWLARHVERPRNLSVL